MQTLQNHFLLAMPSLTDAYFERSLVYLCEHSSEGAMGLVVNIPVDMSLDAMLTKLKLSPPATAEMKQPVLQGGPVHADRGFVLHRPLGEWHSTLKVNDEVGLTSSRDVLQAIAASGEPGEVLVTLGYAGWTAGQLEQELMDNAWLTVAADMSIVFDLPPEERLAAALQTLGVDFANLSEVAGHA